MPSPSQPVPAPVPCSRLPMVPSAVSLAASQPQPQLDGLFADLMHELTHSPPGAAFSARLRHNLEKLTPEARVALVSRQSRGAAPLLVAARSGNADMVEYLVRRCGAALEQRGLFAEPGRGRDAAAHAVTALWAASVAGRTAALRRLLAAGAAVDAASDSGSTPARSACFMSHVDVVRLLIARGADLNRPNHSGGTCLINGVQSPRLCALLLAHGARVDARDAQGKTALHYAAQEHRTETARLLLDAGADPHLRSRAGDDALVTAALKGAEPVLALLVSRVQYPPERRADAYELLGATQLEEFDDAAAALGSWRRATALRHPSDGPTASKRGHDWPDGAAVLRGAREWRSTAELEAAAQDGDALRAQALLVVARVLGPAHKDTVFRLMYGGAAYADAHRYRRCVALWGAALGARVGSDAALAPDTVHAACALTRLLLDAHAGRLQRADGVATFDAVRRALRLVSTALRSGGGDWAARPLHRARAAAAEQALRCAVHLLHVLLHAAHSPEQRARLRREAAALVALDPRNPNTGDSLLHLAASRLTVVGSSYLSDRSEGPAVFPSLGVTRLLLAAGADPRARNGSGCTALHVACVPANHSAALVSALLAGGAHLDTPSRHGDSALALLSALCPPLPLPPPLRPLQPVSLQCLSARALLAAPPPRPAVPPHLAPVLALHRP